MKLTHSDIKLHSLNDKMDNLNVSPSEKKQCKNIVRNSPRQSANAEDFAEAYLHFIVFAEAVKFWEI